MSFNIPGVQSTPSSVPTAYTWKPPVFTKPQVTAIKKGAKTPTVVWPTATPAVAAPPSGGSVGGASAAAAVPTGLTEEEKRLAAERQASMKKLWGLHRETMGATKAAINAKYAALRSQLQTDKSLLGFGYRGDMRDSQLSERDALESGWNQYAGQGIARSGIALEGQAGIASDAATQRAQLTAGFTAERDSILQQLRQGLVDQKAAEKALELNKLRTAWAMYRLQQPVQGA